ncbi:hypothetical protein ACMFMF_002434 [Clarireedia jacksonii]
MLITFRVEDFDGLNTRLSSIETSISQIAQQLSTPRLSTPLLVEYNQDTILPDGPPDFLVQSSLSQSPFEGDLKESVPIRSSHHLVDSRGHEQFFGRSSLYAFLGYAKTTFEALSIQKNYRGHSMLEILCDRVPSARYTLRRLAGLPQAAPTPSCPEITDDGKPMLLPSQALLEVTLDFYMREINAPLPVFERATLMQAINEQYALGSGNADIAWIVCFNCIVLLSLIAKLYISPKGVLSKDEELMFLLLQNIQRFSSKLDSLLPPKVASVQAFLSLGLVTREFYDYRVSAKYLNLAFEMAKSIGLHELGASKNTERTNLFWTMFIMDKSKLYKCSQPCHLWSFECSVSIPTSGKTDPAQNVFIANIKLAYLLEEIYQGLYSKSAEAQSSALRDRSVAQLLARHDLEFSEYESGTSTALRNFDPAQDFYLRHLLLTSRVLILLGSNSPVYRPQILDNSRACLEIIASLHSQNSIRAKKVIANIFQRDPLVTFLEVFLNIVRNPHLSHTRDQELLALTTEAMKDLSDPRFKGSSYAIVSESVSILNETVIGIKQAFPSSPSHWTELHDSVSICEPLSDIDRSVEPDWSMEAFLDMDLDAMHPRSSHPSYGEFAT